MAAIDAASFGLGALFGLSLAAPPGPVNALMALEATAQGHRPGTLVGAGAMTADAIFFALTAFLGSRIDLSLPSRLFLYLLGAVVLILFGVVALRSRAGIPSSTARGAGQVDPRPYMKGLTLGLTNPFQIVWWMTAGLSAIVLIGLTFVAGFFVGICVWILSFPLAVAVAQRRFPSLYRWITYASAAIILAFAGFFLYEGVVVAVGG